MSWVCTNCSTSNEDREACCVVCGVSRPTMTKHIATKSDGCKIVFSDFEAWKESVKRFFSKLSAKGREKKSRPKEEKPGKDKLPISKPSKEKKPEKITECLPGTAFATPWPEHKVKFDISGIESKGFVKSERATLNGVNGYQFYKADGTSQFIRMEMVIIQKMATKL